VSSSTVDGDTAGVTSRKDETTMSENKLYVGNLSFKTTDDQLAQLFASFGTVGRASVVTDRETGRSRGFGFVEMGSDTEAKAAIAGLDGKNVEGRTLQVNVARPREGGGGGGGRGGRGGGGGGGRW
jgi:RNA recognition motif-containing protein